MMNGNIIGACEWEHDEREQWCMITENIGESRKTISKNKQENLTLT
mgnify:CR=1 FL=1